MKSRAWFSAVLALFTSSVGTLLRAQSLSGDALVKSLRPGGYVS